MPQAHDKPVQPMIGSWRDATMLIALLALAAGLRSTVVAVRWQHLLQDPDAYRLIAENLRNHGVYSRSQAGEPVLPTAFRPPLYPILLATFAWHGQVIPLVVATLHFVLGILSVLMAWILARKWHLGHWSYLVATMVACDPILLNQSAEVMTETLATFMALAGLLALTRLSDTRTWQASLLAGMVLGLATLCRPTFLVWTVLVSVWIMVSWRPWLGVRRGALLLTSFCVVLAPWVARNERVMGRPIGTTTHGGYTLLLGNNEAFYRHLRTQSWGRVWDARELLPLLESSARNVRGVTAEHPEIVADRRLYELAQKTIRQDPTMFIRASLVRLLRFWTPLPHQLNDDESSRRTLARWGIACWYMGIFAVALGGVWGLRRQLLATPWVWGLLCVLALMAVHTVYWSNMRMRAPAMPIVYLVLAYGCGQWCERAKHQQPRT